LPIPSVPGAPAVIPVEPSATQITIGIGLCALSIWLMVSRFPERRFMIDPKIYPWAFVIAGLIFLAGVHQVVRGATHRRYREVVCRQCKTKVVGRQTFVGVICPLKPHLAAQEIGKLAIVVSLILIWIALPTNSCKAPSQTPNPNSPGSR
jgi:hypothetical protein